MKTTYQEFLDAYLDAAIFCGTDDEGNPLEHNFSSRDLSSDAINAADTDCKDFFHSCAELFDDIENCDYVQCGHDFFLTRNGHGAGFWDRGLGNLGEQLSRESEIYGEADLYVGDDGFLYFA